MCLDDNIDARACVMRCGHHICNHCIVKLEKPICPTCRAPIFPDPAAAAQASDDGTDPLDPAYFRDGALMDQAGPDRGRLPRHISLHSRPLGLHAAPGMDAASVDHGNRFLLPPGANPPHLQRQFSPLTYSPYRSSSNNGGRRGPA